MRRRPVFIIGIVVAFGLVLGVTFKSCFFTDPPPEKTIEDEGEKTREELINESEIVAHDVELVQGRRGSMEWKLLAKTAKYNQEEKLVGVSAPRLTAYYGEDRKEVFIKADKGEVDQGNDNLTLYDNVVGRFGGLDVSAPYLDYVGGDEKVFLKGGVRVSKPELELTGDEALIDLESRELVVLGHVKAILKTIGPKARLKP